MEGGFLSNIAISVDDVTLKSIYLKVSCMGK